MRIDKLIIKNFKGFEERSFEFPSNFTVVIGNNATGKTTVLDALAVAAGSFLLGIEGADSKHIGREQVRVVWKQTDPKPQIPVIIESEGILGNGEQLTWTRSLEKANGRTTSKYAHRISDYAGHLLKQSRNEDEKSPVFPVIAYHGTGRLWAEHQEKIDYRKQGEGVIMGYKDCLSPKSSSKAFLTWYKTYFSDATNAGDTAAHELLLTFNKTITDLIPEWHDMSYHYGLDELVGFYKGEDGEDHKMYFSQLSDGYRNMIGMVADIAYRCLKLNGHLGTQAVVETPGVVLIDELDLHLHPKWQREIVSRLKKVFPKIQFVCTTHSPFIVQSLEPAMLINLDRVSDVPLDDLSIDEVTKDIMGVDSGRSKKNKDDEDLSMKYLNLLKTGATENELTLNQI